MTRFPMFRPVLVLLLTLGMAVGACNDDDGPETPCYVGNWSAQVIEPSTDCPDGLRVRLLLRQDNTYTLQVFDPCGLQVDACGVADAPNVTTSGTYTYDGSELVLSATSSQLCGADVDVDPDDAEQSANASCNGNTLTVTLPGFPPLGLTRE